MDEKKIYEEPKIEKLDFDFTNAVVASDSPKNYGHMEDCTTKNKKCN